MKSINHYKQAIINRSMCFINERRGWTTDRKIVVIESDDWGSVRMPDRATYEKSLKQGIKVDKCPYCKNDTLASNQDFEALYSVLSKYKDKNGNHPIITANTIVGNPNFDKIRASNFQEYHYEIFTETLKRYPNRSFEMWQEGMKNGLFYPQLHGREHLNIGRWMQGLQKKSKEMMFAFDNNFYGISKTISNENNPSLQAAYDYDDEYGKQFALEAVNEAPDIFEKIFGFKSKSFIAPNYYWDYEIEKILSQNEVEYLQGSFSSHSAKDGNRYHYIGKRNDLNQIYTARNVMFEPSGNNSTNILEKVLSQVDKAFKLKKPAIFSTHRVAFIGSIFEENRNNTLKILDEVLLKIIKAYPNVEFMHSAQLGDLIKQDIK